MSEPFNSFQDTSYNVNIKAIEGCGNKLVRVFPVGGELDAELADFRESKQRYDKLRDRYGIDIVKTDLVVGNDKQGKPCIFTVVDRIEGKNVCAQEQFIEEARQQLDGFFERLFSHYLDAYKEKGYFWADFSSMQIVYGNKIKEKEKHVYIVDVDPSWGKITQESRVDSSFIRSIWFTYFELQSIANRAGGINVFSKSIVELKDLLEFLPRDYDDSYNRLEKMRSELDVIDL